jgi:hypothetical protein
VHPSVTPQDTVSSRIGGLSKVVLGHHVAFLASGLANLASPTVRALGHAYNASLSRCGADTPTRPPVADSWLELLPLCRTILHNTSSLPTQGSTRDLPSTQQLTSIKGRS